ncbi:hypothetical protein AAG570_013416 [Ranatra chinensis]|uniref:DUF4771 domain-containing protein n=1 Tax=Ranatra chinensis TaxID=642074 RepID=A0ABD0YCA5_9HEMI
MASECRNTFYENKKQETTEIAHHCDLKDVGLAISSLYFLCCRRVTSFNKINVECTDENCQLLGDDEVPMDAFELARRQIAVLPEDQQLEVIATVSGGVEVTSQITFLKKLYVRTHEPKRQQYSHQERTDYDDYSLSFNNRFRILAIFSGDVGSLRSHHSSDLNYDPDSTADDGEYPKPAAVKYLCDQGDPLAILPSIEKVPWLVRWFEKRRGVKVKLTEKDKEELMERSRKMWDAPMPMPSSVPLPELPLSQEAADKLTYDDLESTRKIVKKNVGKFFSEVKQLMVGNSRNMYPSMFNEYFDTPLNKSFRTTFFTYMPSREVEAIVYRLWKPEEKKEEQAEEEEEGEDEEQAETKH